MRSFWEVPGEAPHDYAMYARTRTDHEGGDAMTKDDRTEESDTWTRTS